MEGSDLARGNSMRWAWHKARSRLYGPWWSLVIIPIVAAVILGQSALPPRASVLTQIKTHGIALVASLLACGLVLLLGYWVIAPYQQRNALKRTVSDLQTARTQPSLEVRAESNGWKASVWIENQGETDVFQVKREFLDGKPDAIAFLDWHIDKTKVGREVTLVKGGYARAEISAAPLNPNSSTYEPIEEVDIPVRLTFLAAQKEPLALNFRLYYTRLGLYEFTREGEEWEYSTDDNVALVHLLRKLHQYADAYELSPPTTWADRQKRMEEVWNSISWGVPVGHAFSNRSFLTNELLKHLQKPNQTPPAEPYVQEDKECIASWIRDLQAELNDRGVIG